MTDNIVPIRPPGPKLTREQMEQRVLAIENAASQLRRHIDWMLGEIEILKTEHASLLTELRTPVAGLSPLRTAFVAAKATEEL